MTQSPALGGTAPWPAWLLDTRLDDTALAEAYDQSSAPHRALVKQCLALHHALWGEGCEEERTQRVDKALGFCATRLSRPAPWALFVVGAEHNAPTRLAAALMPALLARVPHVAVLCVGGMPSVGTRLALELAGVQDIFCPAPTSAVEECLRELCQTEYPRGCVALLHGDSSTDDALHGVAHAAKELHVPLWQERHAPCIVDFTEHELVKACHPDILTTNTANALAAPCDAVFGLPSTETAHTRKAPLRVGAGLEGFWSHPTLAPSFFRHSSLCITPYTGEDSWAQT